MSKQFIIRQFETLSQTLGYELIPKWRLPTHQQAMYLRRLLKEMKADTVLDVGANCGQYGQFLRNQVGFEGLIISFEPIPDNAEAIRKLANSDGKWMVHEMALGSRETTLKLNVMANTVFSSFLKPSNSAINEVFAENRTMRTIDTPVRRLDDVLPELRRKYDVQRPYLKLDTQGYDLEVLVGAEVSLADIAALQTEASIRPLYEGMPDWRTMIDYLTARGFEIGAMFSVSEAGFPYLVELDCHMISPRHLGPARTS